MSSVKNECQLSNEDGHLVVVGQAVFSEKDIVDQDLPGKAVCSDEYSATKRFKQQDCHDFWATVAFVGVIGVSTMWGTASLQSTTLPCTLWPFVVSATKANFGRLQTSDVVLGVGMSILCLVVCTAGLLTLLQLAARELIVCSLVVASLLVLASAAATFTRGMLPATIGLTMLGFGQLLWLFCVRSRIAFAAKLLAAAGHVTQKHSALFVVALMMALMFAVCASWGLLVFQSVTTRLLGGQLSMYDRIFAPIAVFALCWLAHVLSGVVCVTTAGVVGMWYFAGEDSMPQTPTWTSLVHATTTSFGSVCVGALLNVAVGTLGCLLRVMFDSGSEFIDCMLAGLHELFEGLTRYCNTYASVHVAVYGCSYTDAAQRTWRLCRRCVYAAAFNDALVTSTLRTMGLVLSCSASLVVGLATRSVTVGSVVLLLSLGSLCLVLRVLTATLTTIFVCFAEVPDGLRASLPQLHAALVAADGGIAVVHARDEKAAALV